MTQISAMNRWTFGQTDKHWDRQMDNWPVYDEMNENIGFRKISFNPLLLSVSANNRRCTHSTNGEIR